jgi:hypothetical protein
MGWTQTRRLVTRCFVLALACGCAAACSGDEGDVAQPGATGGAVDASADRSNDGAGVGGARGGAGGGGATDSGTGGLASDSATMVVREA